jgi:NADPH-dependent curcumin reductase CurA
METREIRLARRPHGEPVDEDFELAVRELVPAEGEVLVRNRWMSVDPYMRGRMNDRESYVPPFELGKALLGGAVGELEDGSLVLHQRGWREHALVPRAHARPIEVPPGVSPSAFLGALGMPGMTAWVGLTEIAPVQAGETVFISAATGAVGSVAGQLAKARGCSVIGSAGGPEKVRFALEELGYDSVFDYRADDPREALEEGIDVYFDNVGGPQLEAAIGAMRRGGRIAACGSVSSYNAVEPQPGPANLSLIVGKRITMRGFIVGDHAAREAEFRDDVGGLIADGRLRLAETVVEGGLEAAPRAFIDMLRGRYLGKVVVKL